MFKGAYRYILDDKGRLVMPAKLRKHADINEFILTLCEEDRSLFLFTKQCWEQLEEKYGAEKSFEKVDDRDFIRALYYNAAECTLDKQGRLSIPQDLRDLAEIKKDILIADAKERIEIRAIELWEDYDKQRRLRLAARKKRKIAGTDE